MAYIMVKDSTITQLSKANLIKILCLLIKELSIVVKGWQLLTKDLMMSFSFMEVFNKLIIMVKLLELSNLANQYIYLNDLPKVGIIWTAWINLFLYILFVNKK